ncbi:hypothetical protein B0H19DRAFT_1375890 [Mycena capillaripes]|nr:hypothetical protein B0H19DRAFT_1375890 [Mycena capillaripes]
MPFSALTRQEILDILLLMGVEFPARTKLTDDKLYKRLGHVLDSCQYLSRVVPDPPLVPTSHPLWNEAAPRTSLAQAVSRTNADEADFMEASRARGITDPIPMHTNAFRDLRHSLSAIAEHVGAGYMRYALQDPKMTSDIRLKVLEVRRFDLATPIFMVQYHHYVRRGNLPAWADAKLVTTLKEQHLLLRLLQRNSKRIDPTYQPEGLETGKPFELSFLLPIGPLMAKDRGKHNTIEGCPNCGESAADFKKCSRCLSVSYCSKECQKDNSKVHRPMCSSIHAGTWKEITVQRPSTFNLNRYEIVWHPEIYARSLEFMKTSPPENIHGTLPFIVKIQLAAADASNLPAAIGQRVDPRERDGQSMLIYDRQASMEVALQKGHADAEEFEAVAGLVMKLEVCMDHLPKEQKW